MELKKQKIRVDQELVKQKRLLKNEMKSVVQLYTQKIEKQLLERQDLPDRDQKIDEMTKKGITDIKRIYDHLMLEVKNERLNIHALFELITIAQEQRQMIEDTIIYVRKFIKDEHQIDDKKNDQQTQTQLHNQTLKQRIDDSVQVMIGVLENTPSEITVSNDKLKELCHKISEYLDQSVESVSIYEEEGSQLQDKHEEYKQKRKFTVKEIDESPYKQYIKNEKHFQNCEYNQLFDQDDINKFTKENIFELAPSFIKIIIEKAKYRDKSDDIKKISGKVRNQISKQLSQKIRELFAQKYNMSHEHFQTYYSLSLPLEMDNIFRKKEASNLEQRNSQQKLVTQKRLHELVNYYFDNEKIYDQNNQILGNKKKGQSLDDFDKKFRKKLYFKLGKIMLITGLRKSDIIKVNIVSQNDQQNKITVKNICKKKEKEQNVDYEVHVYDVKKYLNIDYTLNDLIKDIQEIQKIYKDNFQRNIKNLEEQIRQREQMYDQVDRIRIVADVCGSKYSGLLSDQQIIEQSAEDSATQFFNRAVEKGNNFYFAEECKIIDGDDFTVHSLRGLYILLQSKTQEYQTFDHQQLVKKLLNQQQSDFKDAAKNYIDYKICSEEEYEQYRKNKLLQSGLNQNYIEQVSGQSKKSSSAASSNDTCDEESKSEENNSGSKHCTLEFVDDEEEEVQKVEIKPIIKENKKKETKPKITKTATQITKVY